MSDEEPTGFNAFPLSEEALRALDDMGYVEPTPVQAAALPIVLEGRDVIAEAPTGTGKTAAFGLGLVERTPVEESFVALVLVPTRELATQVADEISALGKVKGYRAFAVTGGIREGFMLDRMLGANCLVATPGRLLDLLRKDEITLAAVQTVVLDEADRMLDEGFLPDAAEILRQTPSRQQTMLFSATLPPAVMDLAHEFLVDPDIVTAEGTAVGNITHYRLNVRDGHKTAALEALLKTAQYERCLVFLRTRANVDATTRQLRSLDLVVDPLHGERGDFERRHVMDLFRRGGTKVVLATDVAARGLDVPEIDLVVNFDVPPNVDSYVHRSGRAGRMGREGAVVTFVTPDEKPERVQIERGLGIEMQPYRLDFAAKPPPSVKAPKKYKPSARAKAKAAAERELRPPKKPTQLPSRESEKRRSERLGRPRDQDKRRERQG